MADDHQIGQFSAFADLIGDQAHVQKGGIANALLLAAGGELVEDELAALVEDLAHFTGKIQIGLETQRT